MTVLLLAALILRSFIALGYMPDENGVIRLCTPQGLIAVVIDPETGEPAEHVESLSAQCPWSFAFFSGVTPPGLLPWPIRRATTTAPLRPFTTPDTEHRNRRPPARAPPIALA